MATTDAPSVESPGLDRFLRAMPKAELHVHLEGTVRPATLLELARRHRVPLPARTEAELAEFYRFRDFDHFIEVYMAACSCLRDPADFARITVEYGEEAARQRIAYLEVHFNPESHVRKRGLAFADILSGLDRGRREVRRRVGIEVRWIADGIRDAESGPSSVERTVGWIAGLPPEAGVVALGLGGNEVGYPPSLFVDAFERARAAGLRVVAHAGETTGPEAVWATLRELGAERIGHGIGAAADPSLVAYLAERGIPLEICPTSNLRTRVVRRPEEHPVAALDRAGVTVTLGSDDPPMFGTTLTDEYRFLARHFGYGPADLQRLSLNAVQAAFLPEAERAALLARFEREFAALPPVPDGIA